MFAHIKQYHPNFADKAVLTVSTQDTFVVFRTFDAVHGRSRQIYINRHNLLNWIRDPESSFLEHDMGSSIRIYVGDPDFHMELTSLNENNGELKGFIHRFSIDPGWLYLAVDSTYTDTKLLITIHEPCTQAKIVIPENTQAYIKDTILPDHRLRRAFIKAISRNFMYGRQSTVHLFPDYDGFFFRETVGDQRRLCGGLIINTYKRNTGNPGNKGNDRDYITFSIHT